MTSSSRFLVISNGLVKIQLGVKLSSSIEPTLIVTILMSWGRK